MKDRYEYIFGPVLSRRLGRSLGIDLLPYKTCSLNCLYCECGPTTNLTLERKEYVPTREVLRELEEFLKQNDLPIEVITFSGSGEPTLHSGIGEIIHWIKGHTPYPVCVLTNGTLLYRSDVQKDLLPADIVIPSLDAGDEETFRRINRPHPGLSLSQLVEGIRTFRQAFRGNMPLEVFVLPGINDSWESVKKLGERIRYIKPDTVQLNSLDRPGTEPDLKPEPIEALRDIKVALESQTGIPVHIVVSQPKQHRLKTTVSPSLRGKILSLIRRRPSTLDQISRVFLVDPETVEQLLEELQGQGLIRKVETNRGEFFTTKEGCSKRSGAERNTQTTSE